MNRRDFTKRSITFGAIFAAPYGLAAAVKDPYDIITSKVEVLRHSPNTRYETLRTYSSHEEAVELVKNLTPRLISATIAIDLEGQKKITTVDSGYRKAIRAIYKANRIVNTVFDIIDSRTEEVVIPYNFDEVGMFDAGRAWAVIENIRVDGLPVQMHKTGKIPWVFMQPFKLASHNTVHYVDLQGKELTQEQAERIRG